MKLRTKVAMYFKLRDRFGHERYRSFVRKNGGRVVAVVMGKGVWNSDYCADPFLFHCQGRNWLFYETLVPVNPEKTRFRGQLGCFLEDEDGNWVQQGIVLKEDWHLSYPQVFEDDGHIYMIPESESRREVVLYEAMDFPRGWVKVATLIKERLADSTLWRKDGKYYLIASPPQSDKRPGVWVSGKLTGPWERHPQSDNVNPSKRLRRCGGGLLEERGKLYRITQDCNGAYGKRLYAVEIVKLSLNEYEEGQVIEMTPCLKKAGWPLVHFQHTYNRMRVGNDVYEVIDQRDFPLRPPLSMLKVVGDFVLHNLSHMNGEKLSLLKRAIGIR